jgi:hypothetical protein
MAWLPNATIYGEGTAAANYAYNKAINAIRAKRGSLFRTYGLREKTGGYEADPFATYGKVQMLKYAQGRELDQAYNEAAERRLGHTGLGAQNEAGLRFLHGAQSQQLGNEFSEGLGDLTAAENQAEMDRLTATRQAYLEALRYGVEQRDYDPIEEEVVTPSPAATRLARSLIPKVGGPIGSLNRPLVRPKQRSLIPRVGGPIGTLNKATIYPRRY